MTDPPRVYTPHELADILQVGYRTVLTKARKGDWPYLRFGPQTIRFTDDHVTQILTTSEAPPPQTTTRRRRRTT